MPETPHRPVRPVPARHACALLLAASVIVMQPFVAAPPPFVGTVVAADVAPTVNPLRSADAATQTAARAEAWTTFQRACRPCHGSLGAGDGPYARTFPQRASDLRRPNREAAPDAVRFRRIHDGAASFRERPWESNMPAFGDDLDDRQIWGLVLLLDDFEKEASGLDPDATGADVYAARCAVCHGTGGAGDGPLAAELMPPPRNFVHGSFRLRSTEYGAAPLDTDIIGVAAHGLGDTSMGRFLGLGSQHLEDVAKQVQSFAPKLFATTPKGLTGSPIPAESTSRLAALGRTVYDDAKCGECHGKAGRGDGPSAATLKDDEGHRSIATDLTKQWTLKAGGAPTDIFRTLLGGMNGTPMKSYATELSGDDRWALAHYVSYLGRSLPHYAPTIQTIVVKETLPLDPESAFWKPLLPALVPMAPQVELAPYWTQPSVDLVEVVAAANDEQLGLMLTWNDRSRDVRNEDSVASTVAAAIARFGQWHLPDAVAVEFPERTDAKGALPPSYLGDDEHPVRRWLWSADRLEHDRSQAALIQRIAGPKATPIAITDGPPVETAAAYADGQWRVVLIAKRPPKSVAAMPIALEAWDGAAGESDNWQSLSAWVNVNLR